MLFKNSTILLHVSSLKTGKNTLDISRAIKRTPKGLSAQACASDCVRLFRLRQENVSSAGAVEECSL